MALNQAPDTQLENQTTKNIDGDLKNWEEKGSKEHSRLPNEYLDYKILYASTREEQILAYFERHLYGWNREEFECQNKDICKATGIDQKKINTPLNKILAKRTLVRRRSPNKYGAYIYSFNKQFFRAVLPIDLPENVIPIKKEIPPKMGDQFPQKRGSNTPINGGVKACESATVAAIQTPKESIKESIKETSSLREDFGNSFTKDQSIQNIAKKWNVQESEVRVLWGAVEGHGFSHSGAPIKKDVGSYLWKYYPEASKYFRPKSKPLLENKEEVYEEFASPPNGDKFFDPYRKVKVKSSAETWNMTDAEIVQMNKDKFNKDREMLKSMGLL